MTEAQKQRALELQEAIDAHGRSVAGTDPLYWTFESIVTNHLELVVFVQALSLEVAELRKLIEEA